MIRSRRSFDPQIRLKASHDTVYLDGSLSKKSLKLLLFNTSSAVRAGAPLRYRIAILGQVPKSEAILIKNVGPVDYVACPAGVEWRDAPSDSSLFAIHELLTRLAHAQKLASSVALMKNVDQVAVAVAGTDSRVASWRFENALRELGISRDILKLSSLAECAHVGAFLGRQGALLRCGHGSSVYARAGSLDNCLVGGWGGMLGDHGSGVWIGKKALNIVARAIDGAATQDEVHFARKLIESSSGLDDAPLNFPFEQMEVDRTFNGNLAARRYLTDMAGHVLGFAATGDPCAEHIARRAANHLVAMVRTAISRVQFSDRIDLCFRGSIFVNHPTFAEEVVRLLVAEIPSLRTLPNRSNGYYSPIVGLGLLALNCTEPDEIETIGAPYLEAVKNHSWVQPAPVSMPMKSGEVRQ